MNKNELKAAAKTAKAIDFARVHRADSLAVPGKVGSPGYLTTYKSVSSFRVGAGTSFIRWYPPIPARIEPRNAVDAWVGGMRPL